MDYDILSWLGEGQYKKYMQKKDIKMIHEFNNFTNRINFSSNNKYLQQSHTWHKTYKYCFCMEKFMHTEINNIKCR